MFLAGLRHEIDASMDWLHIDVRITDIVPKESFSGHQPFTKLLVKIKPKIITMRMPLIKPKRGARSVSRSEDTEAMAGSRS